MYITSDVALTVVEQIEEIWYMTEPKDKTLAAELLKWLSSKDEKTSVIRFDEKKKCSAINSDENEEQNEEDEDEINQVNEVNEEIEEDEEDEGEANEENEEYEEAEENEEDAENKDEINVVNGDNEDNEEINQNEENAEKEDDEEQTSISLKYFIRSYRLACQQFVDKHIKNAISKNDINNILKKKLKKRLKVEIGEFTYTIVANPASTHFGNGRILDIGKYSDIWPLLSLITDGNTENNRSLALLFLKFAKQPFAFSKDDLVKINNKFNDDTKFGKNSIDYYRRFLTCLAFLYIFFEPARRLTVEYENSSYTVKPNKSMIHASSIITVLKRLRERKLNIEQVFSPNSDYVLFTLANVNKTSKKQIKEKQDKLIDEAIRNFLISQQFWVDDKETPQACDIKEVILDPDSAEVSEDESDYEISTKDLVKCNIL